MTDKRPEDYEREDKARLKFEEKLTLEQQAAVRERLKTCWKPASSPEATLAVQGAFAEYPDLCDPAQLYYYVTTKDIAKAAGMRESNPRFDVDDYCGGFEGFRASVGNDSAVFVPKSELVEMGVELPAWNATGQSPVSPRVPSRSRS